MRQGTTELAFRGVLVAVAAVCMVSLVTGSMTPAVAGQSATAPETADTTMFGELWNEMASFWEPMVRGSQGFIDGFPGVDGAGVAAASSALWPVGHWMGRGDRDHVVKPPAVGFVHDSGVGAVQPGSMEGLTRQDVPPTAIAGFLSLVVTGMLLLVRRPVARLVAERMESADRRSGGDRATNTGRGTGPGLVEADRHENEYLPDEERVTRLIEANGGRMRQSEIVERVDWSKAKVSRLLSSLDEDGVISKFRLGRENLICLRGNEPSASQAPFASGKGRDD